MAVGNWYLNNSPATGDHKTLATSNSGTAATTTTGWVVAKTAAGNFARMDCGVERTSGNFNTTAQPSGAPDTAVPWDCFRLGDDAGAALNGLFATGTWTFRLPSRAVTSASGPQQGRARFRLWKSANSNGSGATEITPGTQIGTTVTGSTSVTGTSSVTTPSITGFTLTNEYLFLQVAWETVVAGGATGSDVDIRSSENIAFATSPTYSPTQSITAGTVSSTTLAAPTVIQNVTGGTVSTTTVNAPTVSAVGPDQPITSGTVSTTTLTAPTVAYALTGPTLNATTVTAPTVAYTSTVPFLSSTTTVYAPTVTPPPQAISFAGGGGTATFLDEFTGTVGNNAPNWSGGSTPTITSDGHDSRAGQFTGGSDSNYSTKAASIFDSYSQLDIVLRVKLGTLFSLLFINNIYDSPFFAGAAINIGASSITALDYDDAYSSSTIDTHDYGANYFTSWRRVRVHLSASVFQVRAWNDGDAEPSTWDIDSTSTFFAGVGTALAAYGTGNALVDWIAAETDGSTASMPDGGSNPFIGPTAIVYAPSIATTYDIAAATISTTVLTAPAVTPGAVTVTGGTVTSTTLAAPTVTAGAVTVTSGTVSTTTIYAPGATNSGSVALPLVSTTVLLSPSVDTTYDLVGSTVASTTLAAPSLAYTLAAGTVSTTVLTAPTVSGGPALVTAGTVSSTAVFSPFVATTVDTAFVTSTTFAAPTIAAGPALVAGASLSTVLLYAPFISTADELFVAYIPSGTVIYAPYLVYPVIIPRAPDIAASSHDTSIVYGASTAVSVASATTDDQPTLTASRTSNRNYGASR